MRKLLIAIIAAALLTSACGGGDEATTAQAENTQDTQSSSEAPASDDQESEAEATQAEDDEDLQAALLLVQQRGDEGVVDAMVAGYEEGAAEYGYSEAQILEVTDPATYVPTLQQVAESGASLIIATFPPMTDAVATVAPQFPDTKFALIDAELPEDLPNVQELFFYENEASYLAGVAAGMMTDTDKVGFIGGVDADVINRYLVGFHDGATTTNPDVTVCWAYTDDLEDPAKGKEVALSMLNDDIDILHAATAGTQLGIYEAVEEQPDKFLISADVDVRPLAPDSGLFATGPNFDEATKALMEEHAQGEFTSGFIQYGLESGLVGRTEFAEQVPADVQDAVDEAREQIANDEIEVADLDVLPELSNCS